MIVISVLLILNDKKKNIFLILSFSISLFILYFLNVISFLNMYIFYDFIWIINILIGVVCIYCGLTNVLSQNKNNKIIKSNIKVDIPLCLIFAMVFVSLMMSSITYLNKHDFVFNMINNDITNSYTMLYKLTCCFVYLISFICLPTIILLISQFFIEKNKNNNNTQKIGNILLMITGFIISII